MGQFGLLQVSFNPNAQPAPNLQQVAPADAEIKAKQIGDSLGVMLSSKYKEWSDARLLVEEEWLKDLRAYNGIYEADILAAIGKRSKVFVHLTRTKTQTAYSRIVDLLFQSDDKHWEVFHTPVPEISRQKKASIAKQIYLATGGQRPTEEEIEIVINDLAERTAARMSREMEDQLVEAGYDQEVKAAILEACILGSGAIKGIYTKIHAIESWANGIEGWALQTEERQYPALEHVSVFDLYPDPYATTAREMTGIIQRHLLTRTQFDDLKNHPGFDTKKIQTVLIDHPKGNHTQETHEIERRRIAGYNTTTTGSGRFEVLEYWGEVTGRDLIACGCDVEDEAAIYQANVWVCGSHTLMARLNPNKPEKIPYHIFPYKRTPHQFWGVGVPREMRDSQTTMNTSVRVALDNLAISSGPILEVNTSLLAPGESATDIFPYRVFQRQGGDASQPLIRLYQTNNVTTEVVNIMEIFRRFADEETSLPSYTHGEQTPSLNATASGMSMLMGAAQVVTKSTIKNIDDYLIRPIIQSLYHWNMRWNDNERIKGDMQVDARGSTALISKEVQSQRLIQFAGLTANPVDLPVVDRPALLRSIAESMDLNADKVIRDERELEALNQAGGGGGVEPVLGPGMGNPEQLSAAAA